MLARMNPGSLWAGSTLAGRSSPGRAAWIPQPAASRRCIPARCQGSGADGPASDAACDADVDQFCTTAGIVDIVEATEAEVDVFGELSTGNLHFTSEAEGVDGASLGLRSVEDIFQLPYDGVKSRVRSLLGRLGASEAEAESPYPEGDPRRAVFCCRTLNLRSIQAIG